MELTDRFTVQADSPTVWALFWDLPRIAGLLPGCEGVDAIDETHYRAHIVQRVGPFKVTMDLDLEVLESEVEKRVVLTGGGHDRLGNRLSLSRLALELAPADGGGTDVSYSMDFNLYGRMATLGGSVVKLEWDIGITLADCLQVVVNVSRSLPLKVD
ncbi:MAG: hypothetical protein IIC95_11220 [Chloroflexi bacterium]|nr:hypothetical protein [Chloroflexota bacterium]